MATDLITREMALTPPGETDSGPLTIEATVATATPVRRRDARGEYAEILDPAGLDLEGLDVPLLDSHTFGRAISVSRKLLIDDDLNLLGDMTAAMGQAAAQTEADELVNLLTSNPNLSDGAAVFAAGRGNLASSGVSIGSTGDLDALDAGRRAMRTVKGLDGKTIVDALPRFLLVGPESETAAEKLMATIYPANTDDSVPFASRLKLIVEPRIEDDGWWLFADPSRVPALQFAYLQSAQGVQIQRMESWSTLGMEYRAFLDFGTGWAEWRGVYRNPGDT